MNNSELRLQSNYIAHLKSPSLNNEREVLRLFECASLSALCAVVVKPWMSLYIDPTSFQEEDQYATTSLCGLSHQMILRGPGVSFQITASGVHLKL